MKRETIQNVVNSVLATAVVVLFVLHFTCGSKSCSAPAERAQIEASGELMPIAIVNTDSILLHYTLAVEASEKLMSQYEASMVQLDTKVKAFQKEYATFEKDVMDFQKKVEAGAFLSRERAESEQKKLQDKEQQLMAKQQDLENLRQKLSNDLMANQAALTQQLQDSVQAYLNEFNADGHLHLIVNDAVLLNKVAGYDITEEVIEALNARYGK